MNYVVGFLLVLLPVLTNASFRIVGGRQIDITEAPYIARLYNTEQRSTCGGTIIHPRIVVTAGHCITASSLQHTKIRVGFSTLDRDSTENVYTPTRITVHPEFDLARVVNDVAIIQLNKDVTYSDKVKAAKLPAKGTPVTEGTVGLVSGWGALDFAYPGPFNWLKQGELKVLSEATCADKMKYAKRNQNPEAVFCAAGENYETSTCTGDSGGPFVVNDTLVGVTSFGYRCGDWKLPVAFSNVAYYRDFIDKESVLT